MKTFKIRVGFSGVFEDVVTAPIGTSDEVEYQVRKSIESILFAAIDGNNLALNVEVEATEVLGSVVHG